MLCFQWTVTKYVKSVVDTDKSVTCLALIEIVLQPYTSRGSYHSHILLPRLARSRYVCPSAVCICDRLARNFKVHLVVYVLLLLKSLHLMPVLLYKQNVLLS